MKSPDVLSYLVAAHVFDATPDIYLDTRRAPAVLYWWRRVFHRTQALRGCL
jgi:hypothetical protein